jgi:hypothetical protein
MLLIAFVLFASGDAVFGQGISPAGPRPAAKTVNARASVEEARQDLAKWVELQETIAKERADWATAKEIFTQRLDVVDAEAEIVQKKMKEAEREIASADSGKKDAVKLRDEALATTQSLRDSVPALEGQVRKLYDILPEALRTKVEPLYQRMPPDPNSTKVSLAERYQNVIGILNEVNKLNTEVTVVSELREIDTGKPVEVKTYYVGLGQAYYITTAGDDAGYGRPTPTGWVWKRDKEIAIKLREAMAIMNNKAKPHFLGLPAIVKK